MTELKAKVGDKIGIIMKQLNVVTREERWIFRVDTITAIRQGKRDTKVYSKRFKPIEIEEVESNARIMARHPSMVLTQEVFLVTPELEQRAHDWIGQQNRIARIVKAVR